MEKNTTEKNSFGSVRGHLLYEIKEGIYKDQLKLPSEAELAKIMGVSRTMIRDNLKLLEQEGFISSRQGIGTVINKHVVEVVTRVDLELEFCEMIAEAGATPTVSIIGVDSVFCSPQIADRLGVGQNTPVLSVARLVSADGKPEIFCTDYVSFSLIQNYSYNREDFEKPIFYFLEKFCGVEVYMDLTEVRPVLASEYLAGHLAIPEGTPLLHLDEIGYDIDGRRVLYSDEYFVDGILKHTILRKKI